MPQKCRFKDLNCRYFKAKGHIARVYRKKASASKSHSELNKRKHKIQHVENNDLPEDQEEELKLFKIGKEKPEPSSIIPVKMNGATYSMELDTGASVSIMSEESWNRNFAGLTLEKSQVKLKTYTGETLDVIGQARVLTCPMKTKPPNFPFKLSKETGLCLKETGYGVSS